MPIPSTTRLPIPKSWDEFEDICADIFKEIWADPYAKRYGRSGQKQFGIDIVGIPHGGKSHAAVQCRHVDSLNEDDIKEIVKEAKKFTPKLSELHIATTLPRDANLEKFIRTAKWPFRVEIVFWEDLSAHICGYPRILEKHYPTLVKKRTTSDDVVDMLLKCTREDFNYNDETGVYLCKKDVKLQIRHEREMEFQKFREPWVTIFPDPAASKSNYYLEYDGARIETMIFVSTDGHRYEIPLPHLQSDLRITELQYHVGKVIEHGYALEEGLERAQIRVEPNTEKFFSIREYEQSNRS